MVPLPCCVGVVARDAAMLLHDRARVAQDGSRGLLRTCMCRDFAVRLKIHADGLTPPFCLACSRAHGIVKSPLPVAVSELVRAQQPAPMATAGHVQSAQACTHSWTRLPARDCSASAEGALLLLKERYIPPATRFAMDESCAPSFVRPTSMEATRSRQKSTLKAVGPCAGCMPRPAAGGVCASSPVNGSVVSGQPSARSVSGGHRAAAAVLGGGHCLLPGFALLRSAFEAARLWL